MTNFSITKAAIYQALVWEKMKIFSLFDLVKKASLIGFVVLFSVFIFGFFSNSFSIPALSFIFDVLSLFLALFLFSWHTGLFFENKVRKRNLGIPVKEALPYSEEYNMAEFLDFEAAKIFDASRGNSNILFYNALSGSLPSFVFLRALLSLKDIREILKNYFEESSEQEYEDVFCDSLAIAAERGHMSVTQGDILISLSKNNFIFEKLLVESGLEPKDIKNLVEWFEKDEEMFEENKKFWEWKNLIKRGTLAKEWTAGYTLTLDKFSKDISERMKIMGFPEIIGHEEEVAALERILSRRETNNALLVGEPAVGKKTVVQEIARRSFLGTSFGEINYKRVVILDINSILAFSSNSEGAYDILDSVFREVVRAGNVILVIPEFHNFVKGELNSGEIDISGIISNYLTYPEFQIIATCTYQGLHKHVERKPAVLSLFEKVEISEISEEETLQFLEGLVFFYERKYKRHISYQALREVIVLSSRFFSDSPFPKKALGLLDEVMVYISKSKDKVVLPSHISNIVSLKVEIPVGELKAGEKQKLLNLEVLIHERIINQDEAVKGVATALRRARSEITVRKGPMGAFLFMGPTGVGKTETSKALAKIYFGSKNRMLRFDMSEFQNISDIGRLIGSEKEDGYLTTQVRENPFSLILLDEFEKAHKNILNLFLQVIDEGFLTDGLGRKVNFRNSIIIATSNAGYQIILKALKEKKKWSEVKQEIFDYVFDKGIFRPELVNRFDAAVIFSALSKENLLDISGLLLGKLKRNLKEKGIELIITPELKEAIVELGYNPAFGAREMRRVIQDRVENVLASALLSGDIRRGQTVEVSADFHLIVR